MLIDYIHAAMRHAHYELMENQRFFAKIPQCQGAWGEGATLEECREELQGALQSIWQLVTRANQYVDQTAPFKLAKDPTQAARLDEVLYNLVEACRVLAVLLHPFIPGTSAKIYLQLGLVGAGDKLALAEWGGLQPGHTIGEPAALFPRRDAPKP